MRVLSQVLVMLLFGALCGAAPSFRFTREGLGHGRQGLPEKNRGDDYPDHVGEKQVDPKINWIACIETWTT